MVSPGTVDYTLSNDNSEQAALSCQECRRRKIKCSRQLPACASCRNSSMSCAYPSHPLKPGPKPGQLRRSKKRRLEKSAHPPNAMEMGTDMMPTQPDTNAVRQSSPSQRPASFQIMNDSTSSPLLVNLGNPELLNELSTSSQSPKQCSLMDHRRLSWLVHPSHEPTSPAFEDGVDLAGEPLLDESSPVIHADLMSQICNALHTDNRDVHHLYVAPLSFYYFFSQAS